MTSTDIFGIICPSASSKSVKLMTTFDKFGADSPFEGCTYEDNHIKKHPISFDKPQKRVKFAA